MDSLTFNTSFSLSRREIATIASLSLIALVASAAIVGGSLALSHHGHFFDIAKLTRGQSIAIVTAGAAALITIIASESLYLCQKRKKMRAFDSLLDGSAHQSIKFLVSPLSVGKEQSSTRKTFTMVDKETGLPVCFIKIKAEWEKGTIANPVKEVDEFHRQSAYCEALSYELSSELGLQAVPETHLFLTVDEMKNASYAHFFEESFFSELERLNCAEDGQFVPFVMQKAVLTEQKVDAEPPENLVAYQEAMLFNWISGRSDASYRNSIPFVDKEGKVSVQEHDNEFIGLAFSELMAPHLYSVTRTWLLSSNAAKQPIESAIRAKILKYSTAQLEYLFQRIEKRGISIENKKKENIRANLMLVQQVLRNHSSLTPQELCLKMGASESFIHNRA